MFDWLQTPGAFAAFFGLVLLLNIVVFHFGGRKAEAPFRAQPGDKVRFRERGASGHSKRSIITKMGGASRVLEVVVTNRELWIKGIWPMFTFIGTKYDLTHKVPLSQIRRVAARGAAAEVWFADASGRECHVELQLKDTKSFASAVAPGA
jgi:hypothetical protein